MIACYAVAELKKHISSCRCSHATVRCIYIFSNLFQRAFNICMYVTFCCILTLGFVKTDWDLALQKGWSISKIIKDIDIIVVFVL